MTHGPGRPPQVFDRAFLTDFEGVTEIILVRHGEQYVPDWRGGPVGDIIDPPLSERGEAQARLVGERFSTEKVDVVYASPLKRAFETGMAIARHHRLEPVVMPDLREVEVFRDIPPDKTAVDFIGRDLLMGIRERMIREKTWDVYPFSESSAEFRRRTVNAIEGIIATNEGKRVVVACHGGVINAFVGHVIGSPYDMFFRPAHTSVSIVAAGEGIRALHSLNDTHHLRTSEGDFLSH
jgi:broad specificity phosphatase PhoE